MAKKRYQSFENCVACEESYLDRCYHHLTTRGAGGGDEPSNKMSLCFKCHESIHRGLSKFMETHPDVRRWLIDNNRQDILGRLERKSL